MQTLCPHTLLYYIIQIAFLNLFRSTRKKPLSIEKNEKKRMSTKSHERKKRSVCWWMKKVELFTFLNLTWWTIWNFYFRWINKGMKDLCQKGTFLTRVHSSFLISLRVPKLLTKKEQNKGSAPSWSLTKNKLMWCFLHNHSQFLIVTENKHCMLSPCRVCYDSKQWLHFFNKQPFYKKLTLGI